MAASRSRRAGGISLSALRGALMGSTPPPCEGGDPPADGEEAAGGAGQVSVCAETPVPPVVVPLSEVGGGVRGVISAGRTHLLDELSDGPGEDGAHTRLCDLPSGSLEGGMDLGDDSSCAAWGLGEGG